MKKKRKSKHNRAVLVLVFCLLFTGACTTLPPKQRFYWPPLPDEPKIEHLGSYQTSVDFPKMSGREVFLSSFLGEEQVQVFVKPWGIVSDGEGKVFVTDAVQQSIIVFDLQERSIDRIPEAEGAYGITMDSKKRLYVTSGKYHNVLIYQTDGKPLTSFGEEIINGPAGIAINEELNRIYVVDTRDHDIKVFDMEGDFLFAIGKRGAEPGEFNFPSDVDINSKGELVVADALNARVQVLDADGNFIRSFGQRGTGVGDFRIMKGIAVDSEDHVYVTDAMGCNFKIFSMEGDLLLVVGGPYSGKVPGGFNLPLDISIDKNDTMYVVDQMNLAFQVFQYMNSDYLRDNPVK